MYSKYSKHSGSYNIDLLWLQVHNLKYATFEITFVHGALIASLGPLVLVLSDPSTLLFP